MFCKKCGSAVRDGAGFCPKCGARINAFAGGGMKSSDSMETSPGGSPGSFSTQTGPSTPKAPSVGTGNRKVLLLAGGGGVAVSIGSFSYEKLSDRALMLKYSLSLPIVGEISASYQASYSVSKDRLTLDLFGIRTTFKRQ